MIISIINTTNEINIPVNQTRNIDIDSNSANGLYNVISSFLIDNPFCCLCSLDILK